METKKDLKVDEAEEQEEEAPPNPRTGRRLVLSDEIIRSFGNNLAMGLTWDDACALVPVHRDTAYNWRALGEKVAEKLGNKEPNRLPEKKRLLYEFALSVRRAIPRRKRKLLGVIHDSTVSAWQSAAWLLERLHPDEFVVRTRNEVTGKDGTPFAVAAISIPPDLQAQIDQIYSTTKPITEAPPEEVTNGDNESAPFDPYGQRSTE